jgi:hypothetical protein
MGFSLAPDLAVRFFMSYLMPLPPQPDARSDHVR